MSELSLVHYDPKAEIVLDSDASDYGTGAVILHKYDDGNMKAVAHASRSLLPTEKNYSQIEKEALAIIFAVKKFHKFIHGRSFIYLYYQFMVWKKEFLHIQQIDYNAGVASY